MLFAGPSIFEAVDSHWPFKVRRCHYITLCWPWTQNTGCKTSPSNFCNKLYAYYLKILMSSFFFYFLKRRFRTLRVETGATRGKQISFGGMQDKGAPFFPCWGIPCFPHCPTPPYWDPYWHIPLGEAWVGNPWVSGGLVPSWRHGVLEFPSSHASPRYISLSRESPGFPD